VGLRIRTPLAALVAPLVVVALLAPTASGPSSAASAASGAADSANGSGAADGPGALPPDRSEAARVDLRTTSPPEADPSSLLVRRVRPLGAARGLLEVADARLRPTGDPAWDVVEVRPERRAELRRALEADPAIGAVESNPLRRAFAAPNDPAWSTSQASYLGPLRLERAWERAGKGAGQVVAVVDTGVDLSHPDLAGRLLPGYDFVDDDAVPNDANGHGTHVAGIIAAAANNGQGIAGVASAARILPVRVLDANGVGTDADIAAGIRWAADHGATIANLSLGGSGSPSTVLKSAVAYALARDVVVVAPSGNTGTDVAEYPAALAGVVSVAGTGDDGDAAFFSSRHATVAVAAPSIAITSTAKGGGYDNETGTSFAAPIVAGIAALVRSHEPKLSQSAVGQRLRTTARDRGPHGFDTVYGWGTVDALAAVGGPPAAESPTFAGPAPEPDDTPARAALRPGATGGGAIAPEGDEDWYAFDVGAGTWTATVTPPVPSSSIDPRGMDPVVEVYDSAHVLLRRSDTSGLDQPETVKFAAGGGGRFLVRVANAATAKSPGPYTVTVAASSGGAAPTPSPVWVDDTSPGAWVTGVGSGARPSVTFGRTIDAATVRNQTVRLWNARTNTTVAGTTAFDAGTVTATITPAAALAAGPYEVRVAGVKDTGGATVPPGTGFRFTVGPPPDTKPPDTTITAGPGSGTGSTVKTATATFRFTASEPSTFDCRLDGGKWRACTSPRHVTVGPGAHRFRVFARDAAGNEDPTPASYRWTYEATALGYWMVGATGSVYPFGRVPGFGGVSATDVVDIEPTPTNAGYWIVDAGGSVTAKGDARVYPRVGGTLGPGEWVTSISRSATGRGYWLFGDRGHVGAYGDAVFRGDMGATALNGPVLDSVSTPSGRGYYMVASDGGVFAFGDARFAGSMGGRRLNAPVRSLVPDGDGDGYWLVASDGGIFAFRAPFRGSMGSVRLNRPVTGMVRWGDGYLMVGADGGIFSFSNLPFFGSLGANPPPVPIVSVASTG
jgi:type VII secretion-associated serine protease mycosin